MEIPIRATQSPWRQNSEVSARRLGIFFTMIWIFLPRLNICWESQLWTLGEQYFNVRVSLNFRYLYNSDRDRHRPRPSSVIWKDLGRKTNFVWATPPLIPPPLYPTCRRRSSTARAHMGAWEVGGASVINISFLRRPRHNTATGGGSDGRWLWL